MEIERSQSIQVRSSLSPQKWVGRQVVANIEYHSAFGWVIFGGSNIRLEK